MKQSLFLHTFFETKECLTRLVVIPSSCSVSKPPPELYSDAVEKQRLMRMAQTKKVALIFPYDDNIFCGRWHYTSNEAEYTHAPNQRAAMLFEAICAKNKKGFKYNAVYLSEGSGSITVLDELKRLINRFGMLPCRMDSLKIYGFDDAVHLQSYLGCLGVCTPVYYSRGLNALLSDIHHTCSGVCALKALNVAAKAVQRLNGYILPECVHPSLIRRNCFETYFIVSELDRQEDIEACLTWAQQDSRQVTFVLSQDTLPQTALNFVKSVPANTPVFSGAPVGHGVCLNNGQAMTLFAPASLSTPTNVPVLSWADKGSLKIAA